jgi:hypothetical protein
MTNLTLSVDEELLRRARMAALERNTSLNELIRGYMETLTAGETARRLGVVAELREAYRNSTAIVGPTTWTRDDLHDRG